MSQLGGLETHGTYKRNDSIIEIEVLGVNDDSLTESITGSIKRFRITNNSSIILFYDNGETINSEYVKTHRC